MLRYFGEQSQHDCHQCDVCLAASDDYLSEDRLDDAKNKILELLSDGQTHHLTQLLELRLNNDELDAALSYLVAEEMVLLSGSYLKSKDARK